MFLPNAIIVWIQQYHIAAFFKFNYEELWDLSVPRVWMQC